MAKFGVRLLTDDDADAHRALWESSARLLPQHPGFVRAVGLSTGSPVLGVFAGTELRGAVGFSARRGKQLRAWTNPHFAPWSGVLVSTEDAERPGAKGEKFWRDVYSAIATWKAPAADLIEMIAAPGHGDLRGLTWNGWDGRVHYNYVSRWVEEGGWRERLDSATRRQARKAEDSGIEIRFVSPKETGLLQKLWLLNAEKQSLDGNLAEGLARLGHWIAESDRGFIAAAVERDTNEWQSAALIGHDAHRVYYLVGASDPARLGTGAPTLLHREVLAEIDRRALPKCYDWVGANTPNIVRFKQGFGPELEMLAAARLVSSGKARALTAVRKVLNFE